METCFCGPTNMSRLLTATALQDDYVKADDAWQVYYALAMEEVLGLDGVRKGDYNIFLADVDKLIEQKELLSGILTLNTKDVNKKDNIISMDERENEVEFGLG